MSQQECTDASYGILTKGLKTAIVTTLEEIRGRILESVDQMDAEGRSEILIEAMTRHSLLQKYIQSPLMMITNEIEKGI